MFCLLVLDIICNEILVVSNEIIRNAHLLKIVTPGFPPIRIYCI
jgi:hypothetical protein